MEEIKTLLVEARHARRSNWLKCKLLLEEGIRQYPENRELAIELAHVYISKQKFSDAIRVCQKALLFNHDDNLCYIIASCFLNLREYAIALDYFDRIQSEFPEHLYNKAVALARCNRYDESIKLTKRVLDYRVKSVVPYLFLAELYLIKKDYKRSISICDRIESSFGLSGEVFFLRGLCWQSLGNQLRAYWDFHRGEIFRINKPEYYRNYGIVAEGIGKTEKAIELFKQAIEMAPESVGSYMELFRLYLSNNMLLEASDLLKKARNTLPESFPLTLMYNRVIDRLHQTDQRH